MSLSDYKSTKVLRKRTEVQLALTQELKTSMTWKTESTKTPIEFQPEYPLASDQA